MPLRPIWQIGIILMKGGINSSNIEIQQNDYKISNNFLIPRESYIKQQLEQFLGQVCTEKNIVVKGYQGVNPENNDDHSLAARHAIFGELQRLNLFENFSFDMKNGHVNWDKSISRCLVLCIPEQGIKGAIYFIIDLITKNCKISAIEIDKECRGKNYGVILLHSAMLVGLLYKCPIFNLRTTPDAMEFYSKLGFERKYQCECVKYDKELFIDFTCSSSTNNLINKMKAISPQYDLTYVLKFLSKTAKRSENNAEFDPEKWCDKCRNNILEKLMELLQNPLENNQSSNLLSLSLENGSSMPSRSIDGFNWRKNHGIKLSINTVSNQDYEGPAFNTRSRKRLKSHE